MDDIRKPMPARPVRFMDYLECRSILVLAPSLDLTEAIKEQVGLESLLKFDLPLQPLAKFKGSVNDSEQTGILFSFDDYLTLVDFTGSCVRQDKRDAIPAQLPPILQRLNIDHLTWLNNATCFEKNYQARFSRRALHSQRTT